MVQKQQYIVLVCIVCTLERMLPGLENTSCTYHWQTMLQCTRPAARMPGRAKGVCGVVMVIGSKGEERREEKRRERKTEGPRGAEIPQAPQELCGPGC